MTSYLATSGTQDSKCSYTQLHIVKWIMFQCNVLAGCSKQTLMKTDFATDLQSQVINILLRSHDSSDYKALHYTECKLEKIKG